MQLNIIKLFLLFLIFTGFRPHTLLAQKKYTSQIDKYMRAQHEINYFNGNILVAKNGTVIYKKSFGYRNYDTKELLNENSVFELASVSKQFTAIGILLLIDKGKLSLTDSLRKFFPELPYYNITIQNLLSHTSGLPDHIEAMTDKWNDNISAFNNDVIKFLIEENIPALSNPGEKWDYSNTGYHLLALIIEKVSGKSYKEYMQENVFIPLGMINSSVSKAGSSSDEISPDFAVGFVYSDSLKKYDHPEYFPELDFAYYHEAMHGDGIINSTTGDLFILIRALKNSTLLSESLQKEMITPQASIDSGEIAFSGFGVILRNDRFGDYMIHGGGWSGFTTLVTRYLDDDFTIIILSNNESKLSTVSDGIKGILFKEEVLEPYVHKEAEIDTNLMKSYTGIFTDDNLNFEVIYETGKLYLSQEENPNIELIPESGTKFFYANGTDRQIEFETDNSGNIYKIWYISGGLKTEIKKLD